MGRTDNSAIRTEGATATVVPSTTVDSLGSVAARQGIAFGTAVNSAKLGDERYREVLRREFEMVTAETAFKWGTFQPKRDSWDFAAPDEFMRVASENGQAVRGHTLVWHRNLPGWVEDGNYSREEMLEIMHAYIATTVGRYKGQVQQWDVVNEVVDDNGELRDSFWLRTIGPDYTDYAFRWAHEADPSAKLFINEVGAETSKRKSDALLTLVDELKARGVPVHGVGYEAHQTEDFDDDDIKAFRASMSNAAARGLEVAITELDVRARVRGGNFDAQKQAEVYREITQACVDLDACKTLVVWGFTDASSWVPERYPGWGAATLYNSEYQPKAGREAVISALSSKPVVA